MHALDPCSVAFFPAISRVHAQRMGIGQEKRFISPGAENTRLVARATIEIGHMDLRSRTSRHLRACLGGTLIITRLALLQIKSAKKRVKTGRTSLRPKLHDRWISVSVAPVRRKRDSICRCPTPLNLLDHHQIQSPLVWLMPPRPKQAVRATRPGHRARAVQYSPVLDPQSSRWTALPPCH